MGTPPIRYLTLWRLQTAKLHLRETQKTIARLAYFVGYESEEAFGRAFKREFGLPPARWRDRCNDIASRHHGTRRWSQRQDKLSAK